MADYTVMVTDNRHKDYEIERSILEEIGAELVIQSCKTEQDVVRLCKQADGLLLDMAPLTAAAVAGLENCKVINRYGVGVDNVDVNACTAKHIWVTNVPDYCALDVSDHALALLMSCLRQTALRDRLIRQNQWDIPMGISTRLAGKTLGLVGAGRIARALMHKVSGFDFARILVYDPYVPEADIQRMGGQSGGFEEVLAESDFVSLHMPVTDETRGMIDEAALSLMKPTAILINTARGPLVDDKALLHALQSKTIGAAGLDTHCAEPLPAGSEYKKLDNVVLTDHTAYSTVESVVELKTKAAQNIAAVLTGQKPPYPVNQLK